MSEISTWSSLTPSRRYLARHQKRGTRGNIIKALAELVKNSDDTYDRMNSTSGKIEIGYWKLKKTQRRMISGFYVRDWGQGMTKEIAIEAYKKYGEDTSAGARNAAIGVGGKDALLEMEDCHIFTVRDGVPHVIEVRTDPIHDDLQSRILEGGIAESKITRFNSEIRPHSHPLKLTENGTTVAFRVPQEVHCPRLETIVQGLTQYYTLRIIMEDHQRTVELLDLETGERRRIRHKPPKGVVKRTDNIGIRYGQRSYKVDITIKRATATLDKESDLGYALLIADEKGAVLDNTMAGFEDTPAAAPFFGMVIIHGWRQLYDSDETVLTDNREGLDYNHPFNQELRKRLRSMLKKLVDDEIREQGSARELKKALRNRIIRAFSKINALIRKEHLTEFESESEPENVPETMQFSPALLTVTVGGKRYLHLLFNPELVPPSSSISLDASGKGVEMMPSDCVITPSVYPDLKVPHATLSVSGTELEGGAIVKARFMDIAAQAEITVVTEEELRPENGFAFVPPARTIMKGSRRRVRLVIDTRIIRPQSLVELSCNDERIRLLSSEKLLVGTPNLSQYLREELIEIEAEVPGIRGHIRARSCSVNNKEMEAYCIVRVVEKKPPREFLKDYMLDPTGDERQRFRYKDGIVYIHTRSPVLRRYFGDPKKHERLDADKPDAKVILADTIVQCVTEAWARYQIEEGLVPTLSRDKSEEIRRQARKLDFQHGKTIHEIISSSLA